MALCARRYRAPPLRPLPLWLVVIPVYTTTQIKVRVPASDLKGKCREPAYRSTDMPHWQRERMKTPCIGICSTTSLGDRVCRGCKRYGFEVINWNAYDDAAKRAVLSRIEKLVCQILESKLRIFSVPNLKLGLEQSRVSFNPELSPYCWLHNLLKKRQRDELSLQEYGAYVLPEYAHLSLRQLSEQIEEELLVLSDAHYQRYFATDRASGTR